jgi:glutamyl-tRNA synthetase
MTRVRFAPSPTGFLHVGGARTALFNWLYARRHGGTFVLRIEDTDAERSSWEMVSGIVDGLRWLGLDWDEGPDVGGPHAPYFQSQRLEQYRAAAGRLVAEGSGYYCYCSPDSLQQKRQAAEAEGGGWIYDRTCCGLDAAEIARREADGMPRAVRFKVPEGTTGFDDQVHGRIEFPNKVIEDFVVLRSDGQPTYHLSVVVDDIDMEITHVIRGDDHISNTPKHVLLFGAFGRQMPAFAHVPLILGTDKKRLSKRHGATSVMEYERQGYLPEAMVNFLALLGWSPGDDREILSADDLVQAFSLAGISGGNAVFNPEKLDWMNAQYIARLPIATLAERTRPWLEAAGLAGSPLVQEEATFHRLLELFRPRAKRLTDFVDGARPLLIDTVEFEPGAVERHLGSPDVAGHVAALVDALGPTVPFDETHVEAVVRGTATECGIKAGQLIHVVRVAVTGRTASPGLFEVLALLGRDRTLARLERLLGFLSARATENP